MRSRIYCGAGSGGGRRGVRGSAGLAAAGWVAADAPTCSRREQQPANPKRFQTDVMTSPSPGISRSCRCLVRAAEPALCTNSQSAESLAKPVRTNSVGGVRAASAGPRIRSRRARGARRCSAEPCRPSRWRATPREAALSRRAPGRHRPTPAAAARDYSAPPALAAGRVGAVHLDQRAELALEVRSTSCLAARRAEARAQATAYSFDQVVEPDRLVRGGDDRRDRGLMLRAEAIDQQVLEITERHAAIDRAPRSKGDHQCVGAPGEILRPLSRIFDLGHALFERGDRGATRRTAARQTARRLRVDSARSAWAPLSRRLAGPVRSRGNVPPAGNAPSPRSRRRRRRK